jgi:hypothetical protein
VAEESGKESCGLGDFKDLEDVEVGGGITALIEESVLDNSRVSSRGQIGSTSPQVGIPR